MDVDRQMLYHIVTDFQNSTTLCAIQCMKLYHVRSRYPCAEQEGNETSDFSPCLPIASTRWRSLVRFNPGENIRKTY